MWCPSPQVERTHIMKGSVCEGNSISAKQKAWLPSNRQRISFSSNPEGIKWQNQSLPPFQRSSHCGQTLNALIAEMRLVLSRTPFVANIFKRNNTVLTKGSWDDVHLVHDCVSIANATPSCAIQSHGVHFVHKGDGTVFMGDITHLFQRTHRPWRGTQPQVSITDSWKYNPCSRHVNKYQSSNYHPWSGPSQKQQFLVWTGRTFSAARVNVPHRCDERWTSWRHCS